jgi:hypothetical protein
MPEEVNVSQQYCELVDSSLPLDHPYFSFLSEIRLAESFLGLAVSVGKRLNETRLILDLLDTIVSGIEDPNVRLSDENRKMLNHADEVWLDLKEKLSSGDVRAAYLLASSAHMSKAAGFLVACRKSSEFSMITDYTLQYLKKLSVHTYREAIGHVML